MKTFPVTVYDLKARHFLGVLGGALGVLLIVSCIYALQLSGSYFIEQSLYRPLFTNIFAIAFGIFLLCPKRIIKGNKILEPLFYLLSGLFIIQMLWALYLSRNQENFWIYAAILGLVILVTMTQVYLLRRIVQPVGAEQADQPPVKL